jgi:hypothetical protein
MSHRIPVDTPGAVEIAPATAALDALNSKRFLRIDVDDSFKTISVGGDSTVADIPELMFKKLCKGKVTEAKLIETKAQYATYWLYEGMPDGSLRKMEPTEEVFPFATQNATNLKYADSGEDYRSVLEQSKISQASAHPALLSPCSRLPCSGLT